MFEGASEKEMIENETRKTEITESLQLLVINDLGHGREYKKSLEERGLRNRKIKT